MAPTKDWIAALVALAGTALLAGPVNAQTAQDVTQSAAVPDSLLGGATVTLEVDGMSCPFCAYGLEKRLRELPAVDMLVIRVSDGVVQIRAKDGQELTDRQLREAVERAGFTLREIHRIERP
jgi:mercuric ion binding protein